MIFMFVHSNVFISFNNYCKESVDELQLYHAIKYLITYAHTHACTHAHTHTHTHTHTHVTHTQEEFLFYCQLQLREFCVC